MLSMNNNIISHNVNVFDDNNNIIKVKKKKQNVLRRGISFVEMQF